MPHAKHSSNQASGMIRITGMGDHDRLEWMIRITGIRTVRQDPAGLEGSEDQHARGDTFQEETARFWGSRLGCGFIRQFE